MAKLRVRYRGDIESDEWDLNEGADLIQLSTGLTRTMRNNGHMVIGVKTREGDEFIDYAMVGISMGDVVAWELDGFIDEERVASVWRLGDAGKPEEN